MEMKPVNKAEYKGLSSVGKVIHPKNIDLYVWLLRMCGMTECSGKNCKGCQYDRAYLRGEFWE